MRIFGKVLQTLRLSRRQSNFKPRRCSSFLCYHSFARRSTLNTRVIKNVSIRPMASKSDSSNKGDAMVKANLANILPVALIHSKTPTTSTKIVLIPLNLFDGDDDAHYKTMNTLSIIREHARQIEAFSENLMDPTESTHYTVSHVPNSSRSLLDQYPGNDDVAVWTQDEEALGSQALQNSQESFRNGRVSLYEKLERAVAEQEMNRIEAHDCYDVEAWNSSKRDLVVYVPENLQDKMQQMAISSMQLAFEMDMSNIRDAILRTAAFKDIDMFKPPTPKSLKEPTLVMKTNLDLRKSDAENTIPLDFNALIQGTVEIDPSKYAPGDLGKIRVPEFSDCVTAIAANICSTALQKGFPADISRMAYSTNSGENKQAPARDPHIVCVREGSKGCLSPGNADYPKFVPQPSTGTPAVGSNEAAKTEKAVSACISSEISLLTSSEIIGYNSRGLMSCKAYARALAEATKRRAEMAKDKCKSSDETTNPKKEAIRKKDKCGDPKNNPCTKPLLDECGKELKKDCPTRKKDKKKKDPCKDDPCKKADSKDKGSCKTPGTSMPCGGKKQKRKKDKGNKKDICGNTEKGSRCDTETDACRIKKDPCPKPKKKKCILDDPCKDPCEKEKQKKPDNKKKCSSTPVLYSAKCPLSNKQEAKASGKESKCQPVQSLGVARKSKSTPELCETSAKESSNDVKSTDNKCKSTKEKKSNTSCGPSSQKSASSGSSESKCKPFKSVCPKKSNKSKCDTPKKSVSSSKCETPKKTASDSKCDAPKKSASDSKCAPPKKSASDSKCGPPKKSASDSKYGAPKKSASDSKCAPPKKSASDSKCAPPKKSASDSKCGPPKKSTSDSKCAPPKKSASDSKCAPPKKSASDSKCGPPKKSTSDSKCGPPKKSASDTKCAPPKKSASDSKCAPPKKSASDSKCGPPKKSASDSKCGAPKKSASDSKCGAPKKSASDSKCGPSKGNDQNSDSTKRDECKRYEGFCTSKKSKSSCSTEQKADGKETNNSGSKCKPIKSLCDLKKSKSSCSTDKKSGGKSAKPEADCKPKESKVECQSSNASSKSDSKDRCQKKKKSTAPNCKNKPGSGSSSGSGSGSGSACKKYSTLATSNPIIEILPVKRLFSTAPSYHIPHGLVSWRWFSSKKSSKGKKRDGKSAGMCMKLQSKSKSKRIDKPERKKPKTDCYDDVDECQETGCKDPKKSSCAKEKKENENPSPLSLETCLQTCLHIADPLSSLKRKYYGPNTSKGSQVQCCQETITNEECENENKSDDCDVGDNPDSNLINETRNEVIRIMEPCTVERCLEAIPNFSEYDILVRTEAVALSGSDIHYYETGGKSYPGMTLGHDATGVVEEVGCSISKLRPGDRVVIESGLACGICDYCKRGCYNICNQLIFNGFLRKYQVHPADLCHKIPSDVDMIEATLTQTLALGCQACFKAQVLPSTNVLVIGASPTAISTALCARAIGAGNICLASTLKDPLEVIEQTFHFNCMHYEPDMQYCMILECLYSTLHAWPDAVINCAVSERTMNLAVMALKPCGVCVLAECDTECACFNAMDVLMKNLKLLPSFRSINMFPTALNLIDGDKAPIGRLISRVFEWQDVEQAFKKALHESNVGNKKVIVRCSEEEDDTYRKEDCKT